MPKSILLLSTTYNVPIIMSTKPHCDSIQDFLIKNMKKLSKYLLLIKIFPLVPTYCEYSAGIFEQYMGVRNQVGIGLSYRLARLHRLAESIPGLLQCIKISSLYTYSIPTVRRGTRSGGVLDSWPLSGDKNSGIILMVFLQPNRALSLQ